MTVRAPIPDLPRPGSEDWTAIADYCETLLRMAGRIQRSNWRWAAFNVALFTVNIALLVHRIWTTP